MTLMGLRIITWEFIFIEEDFVYEIWEQDGRLKELEKIGIPDYYIDWEAIARDWFINDFFSAISSYQEVYVFSRH